ncbi:hypothetical protein GALMADRAFT_98043 [Galerina marginata CBS 339.88]|uniref:F-box domain-containing protein n=1 Tax=Galerina marginata (strain CBS 339.88) TaxID=685588 RepID=A0A067SY74_GALM3|nr:hypothetical protein GALMADRAFT_98043 [Galerina marginata CBS 339.88]
MSVHYPQQSQDNSSVGRTGSPLALAHGDLLIEVARFLETRLDLLNFGLTSNYVFANVSAVLYETVILESVEQCSLTLGMLFRRFDIARHVRELIIRPQVKQKTYFNASDSAIASAAMRKIAGAMCLDALVRFQWDADELPFYDDMWFALRLGCPQLRYLGTSLGAILPTMNSHLFDFQDLTGFSLTLKHGFYESQIDMFLDEDEPVFKKFWDMLIRHCYNLEELTINGHSSVPTDIHLLVDGRWPRLRKLVLGDVCVDWFQRSLNPGEKRPFIAFLEAHPCLDSLSISRHTIQPIHLNSLDATALVGVTNFSGTHQQLHALPHLHRTIADVTFRDPVETRDVSAPTVASLLRDLPSLTSLKISFTLHSMYDSGNLLRSLIQSCPMLRHLELTCGHKPSFQLDAFAKTIRGFPKLRSLHLTIVKYPGDETLASGATRIAKSNPRLQKFSLTFIPPVYPVPLPFSITYRPFPFSFPARATGFFEVSCDHHGLPLSLSAVEHSTFVWPWGMGVSSRSRKYWRDLRPVGYLSRRKTGFRGFLHLMVERSSAGEEMRMILFCAFLGFLAGCGVALNGGSNRSRLVQPIEVLA